MWIEADCGAIDDIHCEDSSDREVMGRDGIVDVGRETILKMYIWEVGPMEDWVIECMGDGGRELPRYPIEGVLLKKEPDHEDGLM